MTITKSTWTLYAPQSCDQHVRLKQPPSALTLRVAFCRLTWGNLPKPPLRSRSTLNEPAISSNLCGRSMRWVEAIAIRRRLQPLFVYQKCIAIIQSRAQASSKEAANGVSRNASHRFIWEGLVVRDPLRSLSHSVDSTGGVRAA